MGIYNLGGGGGAPELQAKEATPLITNAQQIIVPDNGYDGLSKVTVNPMPTGALKTPTVNSIGYVSSGVQTAGYFDTSATSGLQLSTQAAKTITPTTYSQIAVASGKYTIGAVTVAGDANLIPSNILSGKNIFGVEGGLIAWQRYWYTIPVMCDSSGYITVSFPAKDLPRYTTEFAVGRSDTTGLVTSDLQNYISRSGIIDPYKTEIVGQNAIVTDFSVYNAYQVQMDIQVTYNQTTGLTTLKFGPYVSQYASVPSKFLSGKNYACAFTGVSTKYWSD